MLQKNRLNKLLKSLMFIITEGLLQRMSVSFCVCLCLCTCITVYSLDLEYLSMGGVATLKDFGKLSWCAYWQANCKVSNTLARG